jgi:hypothetical protein
MWLIASILFSWYLANFADYNATYGSLGAVIGFMLWTWISVVILLLGAELNSEIEHQTARDSTTGPERPLGARGATMADTVGAPRGTDAAEAEAQPKGPLRASARSSPAAAPAPHDESKSPPVSWGGIGRALAAIAGNVALDEWDRRRARKASQTRP